MFHQISKVDKHVHACIDSLARKDGIDVRRGFKDPRAVLQKVGARERGGLRKVIHDHRFLRRVARVSEAPGRVCWGRVWQLDVQRSIKVGFEKLDSCQVERSWEAEEPCFHKSRFSKHRNKFAWLLLRLIGFKQICLHPSQFFWTLLPKFGQIWKNSFEILQIWPTDFLKMKTILKGM